MQNVYSKNFTFMFHCTLNMQSQSNVCFKAIESIEKKKIEIQENSGKYFHSLISFVNDSEASAFHCAMQKNLHFLWRILSLLLRNDEVENEFTIWHINSVTIVWYMSSMYVRNKDRNIIIKNGFNRNLKIDCRLGYKKNVRPVVSFEYFLG